MLPHLKHRIGHGQNTYFWFDNWHPGGPITARFGERLIYDSGPGKHAKVSDIIIDGSWSWLPAETWELRELKDHSSLHLKSI